MAVRSRRRSASTDQASEEGPFVSFTDLVIGILFLFLILVAALILMHQEAMARARAEAEMLRKEIARLEAELAKIVPLDPNDTPFRLAIVYNSFQRPGGSQVDWRYTRTVQIFRAPNGNCLENVTMRNNLNTTWKPPVELEEVPNAADPNAVKTGAPCTLTASGERWNSETETGGVDRVSANLYSGYTILHTKEGDKPVDIQFRILGVYDDYYRSTGSRNRLPPPSESPPPPKGTFSLQ